MEENKLSGRALLVVVVVGIVCALAGASAAYLVLSSQEPRFRAETQVALLPARNTPPEDLSNYWEALSRGQAARIAAEVLGQRRWLGPAAQAAGVATESIRLAAGAVADTTLIDVSMEAGSAAAAEIGLDTAVREARPVVEEVSGPFALEVVQSAAGSAEELGVASNQLIAVAGATGLLIGGGLALMVLRRRARRQLARRVATPTPDPLESRERSARAATSKAEDPLPAGRTVGVTDKMPAVNGRASAAAANGTSSGHNGRPVGPPSPGRDHPSAPDRRP
ncbi:hypothetical protein [Pseudonocardia nigra]|uniref:hypothetical protein n=1 Tax=Pseudonocardia nigra TaxID=1921578 RepID=UPI001C5CCC9F|nr:hypothetical protein [Pseudonocardia nigra]